MVEELWQSVGTRTSRISAARHDDLVAHTSHVLHILASALALSILDSPDGKTKLERFRGCATGFRDTSRIASSSPIMWRRSSKTTVSMCSAPCAISTAAMKNSGAWTESGDFDGFEREFAEGKLLRDSWLEYKSREQE